MNGFKLPADLVPGVDLGNRALMAIFKCACEGGIRPSRSTNTVVLVFNHLKNINKANWKDGVLDYAGSGGRGDQTLDKGLNRSLMRAFDANLPVYLFEVFRQGKYTFKGRVKLANAPFTRPEADKNGQLRKVWIFPLSMAES